MPLTRRRALAACALLAAAPAAQAQTGPTTLVVPYTPGTGPDILARLATPPLAAALGGPVIVDDRPGASGNIGAQFVARAAPDGRTLMLEPNTFVMNPSLFRQVPYDPVASFTPIALMARGDLVLAVRPDLAADTPAAFAALSRATPGGLDYASPGAGTPQHMAMELFRQAAGIELNHIPYRGSAPAIQDLIGRRVAAMVLPIHTALPLAADGGIRLLATGSTRRPEAAPAVPTFAESGYPTVEVDLWYGLLGPAGLPPALVATLNAALNAWVALPATRETLRAQGMTPAPATPEAFAALIRQDRDRWATVIRTANISAD